MRLRARTGRGQLGLGDGDEGGVKVCACAPTIGFKTGLVLGGLVLGTIGILVGGTLADEASRRKR